MKSSGTGSRTSEATRRAAAVLLACAAEPAMAADAPPAPRTASASVAISLDRSDVRILGRDLLWRSQRIQWDRRTAEPASGIFLALDRQQRQDDADLLLSAGGHRLWPRWVAAAQVEAGASDNAFLPRHALEASLGYRVRPDLVLRVGTRQARYAASRLHLASASVLAYRGQAEWELGWRGGRAGQASRSISIALVRGQWNCSARWTCGVDARGGRNVFGADELGLDTGRGWTGAVHAAYRLANGDSLRVDLAAGRARDFRTDTVGLSYRHAFGQ